jgi:sialidase-1
MPKMRIAPEPVSSKGPTLTRRCLLTSFAATAAAPSAPRLDQITVWRAGEGGYHTYRIPAVIRTKRGTLLAFCEGRRDGRGDAGNIDLLMKRSGDGGATWSGQSVVADLGADTIGNPAPVVDQKTGVIHLLLTRNPGHVREKQIIEGTGDGTRTVWVSKSSDDGATWEPAPREITADTKAPGWTWYATGPGNGIQLRSSGRLVVPCDHNRADGSRWSHVIFSDDHGAAWKLGGSAGPDCNECAIAQATDGSLILNMRSYAGKSRRAISRSTDGGLTWSKPELDEALIEPICQGSLIRHGRELLFSNPASQKRMNLTVKASADNGRTWRVERVVHEGPAAYSSLVDLGGNRAGLLYERGEAGPYEEIVWTGWRRK